jgi:hypothetical protein
MEVAVATAVAAVVVAAAVVAAAGEVAVAAVLGEGRWGLTESASRKPNAERYDG